MITSITDPKTDRRANSGVMKIDDVRSSLEKTHADTMAWQSNLKAAMFNSITAEDVQAIIAKQVAKAKEGNEAAAKFILTHVLGTQNPVNIRQANVITDPETAARLARGQ